MEKQTESVSIWTITGGILLALVIWRAYNVWQYNRAMDQFNAMMVRTLDESKRSADAAQQQLVDRQRNAQQAWEAQQAAAAGARVHAADATKLQPDERCIKKQRFRRVANGWEQVGSC